MEVSALLKQVPQRLRQSRQIGIKGAMYFAIPRRDWSSWVSCWSWMAQIASTFSGSGCAPSASNNILKNVIILSLITRHRPLI